MPAQRHYFSVSSGFLVILGSFSGCQFFALTNIVVCYTPLNWNLALYFLHTIDSELFLKRITESRPGHKRIGIWANLLADAGYVYIHRAGRDNDIIGPHG